MVVDVVVRHCGYLVAERGRGSSSDDNGDASQTAGRKIRERDDVRRQAEEGHERLMVKAEFFYVENRMVDSTDPGWLQSEFDTLTGIFYRVGI